MHAAERVLRAWPAEQEQAGPSGVCAAERLRSRGGRGRNVVSGGAREWGRAGGGAVGPRGRGGGEERGKEKKKKEKMKNRRERKGGEREGE